VHFEIASRKTWRSDTGEKRDLYARIRVQQYFVFDPEAKYIDPPLQGFRTVRGKSVPIAPEADGSLISKELGIRLVAEGERLRLFDLKTGERILSRAERADLEALRAEREKARADQLAKEVERLRRQLAQRKAVE
jgi:hypothetical protein